jgi:hypothetical protein
MSNWGVTLVVFDEPSTHEEQEILTPIPDTEGRAEEVEKKKAEQLSKQKEGKGHWEEGLASDSESAVCLSILSFVVVVCGFGLQGTNNRDRSRRIATRAARAPRSRLRSCRRRPRRLVARKETEISLKMQGVETC